VQPTTRAPATPAGPAGWRRNPLTDRALLTAVVYVAVGVMPLYLTSAQLVSLDAALAFDAARLGLATAFYFGLAALTAQPVAALVDRLGARRGLQCGAVLALAGSATAAAAASWWPILVAVMLAGLANAFMQVSTNVVLAVGAAFHRQGLAFGAKQGAVPLAGAMSGALVPSIGVAVGWRWPYVVAVALAALAVVAAPAVAGTWAPEARVRRRHRPRLSRSLRLLAIGGALGGAAGNGLALFVVPAAVDVGTSEAAAGTILAVGSALVFLARAGVGAVADHMRSTGQREMAVLLALGALASFGLAVTGSATAFIVLMPLGLLGAWGWPGLAYFSAVRIHPEAAARASGVVLATNLTGTVIGPLIVSQLADRGAYSSAWTLLGVFAVAASCLMLASLRAMPAADRHPSPAAV
jgi:MFS family permease